MTFGMSLGAISSMRLCLLLLVGCSRTVGSAADAAPDVTNVPPYEQTLPDGPCAVENVTGTIPGVTLAIRSSSCVYKRGTAATFTYEVTTTANTPAITVPDSGGGCSSCRGYTTDPITFTGWISQRHFRRRRDSAVLPL